MAIKLTEYHINNLVFKILNGETKTKQKLSFTQKFENLIEFHIKYYKGLYNVYGNVSELDKNKRHYLTNLFPNNHKIIKECRLKFTKNIISESEGNQHIDDFFAFIKENYIKEVRKKIISEQKQPQQTKQQQKQKMAVAKQAALPIVRGLMKAFDGAGTDEALAVQTIKKIKSKEEIYQINKLLLAYKRPNLKDYINGDMSDIDSNEYRAIWAHLGKFGVTGANFNNFLAGVGKAVDVIGAGWEWLKKNGLTKLMTTIRDFLDSGWGQAAQLFLDSFGIGAVLNVLVWGLMAVWDLLNNNWGLLVLSSLSILTAGAIAPLIGKFAKQFKGITGGFTKVMEFLKTSAIGKGIKNWIPKISAGIGSIGKYINGGVNWLLSKFGKYIPSNWSSAIKSGASKAAAWVKSVADNLMNFAGKGAGEEVATKTLKQLNGFPGLQALLKNPKWAKTLEGLDAGTSKLVDEYITANIRKFSWGQIEQGVCKNMNPVACKAVKTVGLSYKLKREAGEAIDSGKTSIKTPTAKKATAGIYAKQAISKEKETEKLAKELAGAEGEGKKA